ncbi:nitrite reductase large subunit NirB [Marinifilum caeruleilacunae]|uniref:Nitrite reductase large subunit n=1 Tax=Marinifilum caeruleilacunae TaxID=2499076 RepID=A0ABX1WYT2_9BACT|nr:nitrite reductase large subunit NirB [Marinifilum caeruleilacunae]NOU61259.1 nitrite reductase large subunit [Marinifilum caeruleilacunae]
MKKIILIGNGMTGFKFCEKFVASSLRHEYELLVFGEEKHPAYDRVHLSSYYTGTQADDLYLAPSNWYLENKIHLRTNEKIVQIDRESKSVLSEQGKSYAYDILVLATGSSAFVPPINGLNKKGVFVYRTLSDIDEIKKYVPHAKKAAIIGGGLLGLEAAKAVLDDGLQTSIIEFAPRLMPRQLDDRAAEILKTTLQELDLEILLNKSTEKIIGSDKIEALQFTDGSNLKTDLLIISAGIKPRDELAKSAGLEIHPRGGILVNSRMETADPSIFAIGECVVVHEMVWGLVAPCYEMAEVLIDNLQNGSSEFLGFDLSSKLKLIGTDVASFGDAMVKDENTKTIIYENKASGIYKRLNITKDCKYLLGGILVGESEEFNLLKQVVNNKMPLPANPEDFILGARGGDSSAGIGVADLPGSAIICSCENISKENIEMAIEMDEAQTVPLIKKCTKAGTGCGGCIPMLDDILTHYLKSQGLEVRKTICEHFDYTRQELYDIIKVNEIKTFDELLKQYGKGSGCETCKPLIASLLASIWNDLIVKQDTIQDTNDRFLANIQQGGVYSVVPRVPGGEITPDKLILIGQVAKKYDLYTKITGGQRVDLFGARVDQLPIIWEELIAGGFESGHAYGKSLRTVKSCVGSTWCRFGMHDSVSFAIEIENRYKGLRSPHKLKGGVSGCVRECAEARSKDFGIIATEKGWNLFVCGNGGANPRHADLLASDLSKELVIKYLDRFLMYYIKTAEPLTRTSKWLSNLEGGLKYLQDVVINDCLSIGDKLETEMDQVLSHYKCEWTEVVKSPELRKKFRQFVNTDQKDESIKFVSLRDQKMPAK